MKGEGVLGANGEGEGEEVRRAVGELSSCYYIFNLSNQVSPTSDEGKVLGIGGGERWIERGGWGGKRVRAKRVRERQRD